MSTQNNPAEVDLDPWGRSSQDAADGDLAQVADHGEQANDDHPVHDAPLDVEASEVAPKRKSPVVPVLLGVVALGVLGVVGSAGLKVYRALVPQQQVAEASAAPIEEIAVPAAPAAAAVTEQPSAAQLGLPSGGAASAGMEPAASISLVTAPAVAAPVLPASPAPTATPAQTTAEARSRTAAAEAAPPAAAPTSAEKVVQARQASEAPSRGSRPAAKPSASVGSDEATAARAEARAERARARAQQREQVAAARKARAAAAASSAKSVESEGVAERVSTGQLTGYRVESIDPKFGEFQLAWVRTRSGALRVVTTGDTIDGARVTRVDGSSFSVQTTQGVIR